MQASKTYMKLLKNRKFKLKKKKLIVKKFKLNINYHIKTSKNHNFFQV
jgi:hypothetical protein